MTKGKEWEKYLKIQEIEFWQKTFYFVEYHKFTDPKISINPKQEENRRIWNKNYINIQTNKKIKT